jgi:cardiolipin synthase A/B
VLRLHSTVTISTTITLLLMTSTSGCGSPSSDAVDATGPDGNTIDARITGACEPSSPRTSEPEVFVGPTGYSARFKSVIDNAARSIDVQMYLFTVAELSDALIRAKQRGVAVRVLLDPDQPGNKSTRTKLLAAGVETKDDPAVFDYAHAKYLIIDSSFAVVSSGNFNYGAVNNERNYGFITRDANDVADLSTIFTADWSNMTFAQGCTRFLVSPYNSRPRLLAHINSAMTTLELELMYLSDSDVFDAVKRAKTRGATVRVILAPTMDFPGNASTITALRALGIEIRVATTFSMHAKLIVADGVAFVGSENMSFTSLSKNREVGALIFEPTQAAIVTAQFNKDWASEPLAP